MIKKYVLESLGCSKNLVDAEEMVYILNENGYEMTDDIDDADVAIVNTCGFIESAKEESIDTILNIASHKQKNLKHLIVTGCLVQRYYKDLKEQIPEIDAFLGTTSYNTILNVLQGLSIGKDNSLILPANTKLDHNKKKILTDSYYAYIKIAEGCDNSCTYCIIPKLRGRYVSRPMEEIVEEAKRLASQNVKEIVLIAQDTSKYGLDIYGEKKLPNLLRELSKIEGIRWIRFLYTYPEDITDELVQEVKNNDKVCSYFDIPIQHASNRILKLMNRSTDRQEISDKINLIRSNIKDAIIRTTLITGFPTESQEDIDELADFVRQMKFDKLGVFPYSREEGTKAGNMDGQIEQDVKNQRAEMIMRLQQEIVREKNESYVGRPFSTIVDEVYEDYVVARSYMDVIEVDTVIYVNTETTHEKGDFIEVKITDVLDYDLKGVEV
ncbi:ribosomal protein S12 methylthiotransferase RimO [[Eubacterium] yurii subsp. margaretiae ATCC 43715]|nr:ribosomal protein S12 methylthiotransferase RimO [[Eubacterium] yurii subsp. margaretiae ATCC 43715]